MSLQTIDDLSQVLNIKTNYLKYLLYSDENFYYEFEIKKKSGGTRKITAPKRKLKLVQKRILEFLVSEYQFPNYVTGFTPKKSIKDNADIHVNCKHILNIDIKDFFPTIHFGRVRGMFMNPPFNYSNEVATILAKLTCVNGQLPQGAPSSPIISNIICYSLDKDISHYTSKYNCKYSRYADDIAISTTSYMFPNSISELDDIEGVKISKNIYDIFAKAGFKINEDKTSLSSQMMRQEVTGLIINVKTNIKKVYIKELRAILYNCKNGNIYEEGKKYLIKHKGMEASDLKNEQYVTSLILAILKGKINFLKMVRGELDTVFLKYAAQYNRLVGGDVFNVDKIKDIPEYVKERCCVIQTQEEDSQGTGFKIDGKIKTSTHIFINKTTIPTFIFDSNNLDYSKQFPIETNLGKLPFFNFKTPYKEKQIIDYLIECENVETDLLDIDVRSSLKNFIKSNEKPVIGQKVYMIGYGNFLNFEQTEIITLPTTIISISTLFGRKFFVTDKSPVHGMSGGPVINENKEVIGIVYAGADLEEDYREDNVGFISIV